MNGKMILDFNRTRESPCAYNPYTTCPLPSEQNRLRTRIEAGEMRYDEAMSKSRKYRSKVESRKSVRQQALPRVVRQAGVSMPNFARLT